MARLISASIDLAKINKALIVDKNGAKYYNITISVNDEADDRGNDTAIWTNQSKEERDSKAKKSYIGNGKTVWTGDSQPKQAAKKPTTSAPVKSQDDDLGF